ncbi:MAG: ABC transporter ATP-binding protein [Candidatus Wallbacteria bacterium]
MIEVQNLTKNYGDFTAISNVTFNVKQGEIMGFLGPNAAGKTTTMRIITGFLSATAGTVKVDGHDIYDDAINAKRLIGYLPEKPPVYPEMSVRSYLKFVGEIKGIPVREINKAVELAMEKTNISNVAGKLIGHLSKGYQQRVGLAQALVHNPKLLILDEPTVGLDPLQINEVRTLIKNLKDAHTVILSTHILPEVSITCSRVVIINHGRIIAEDATANLTKAVSKDERMEITITGEATGEQIKTSLEPITGIKSVNIINDEIHKNARKILIETSANFEIAPLAAARLLEIKLNIHELRTQETSLEDIFLKLITKEESVNA